jgi:hypothetical protein
MNVELITSIVSLVVAVVTALFAKHSDTQRRAYEAAQAINNRRHEEQLAKDERRHAERLQTLQAKIDDLSTERDARIDYEYQARKNLYGTVAPLLFQLGDYGEGVTSRIFGLARTARAGDLGPHKRSWLAKEGYYFTSTLYSRSAS